MIFFFRFFDFSIFRFENATMRQCNATISIEVVTKSITTLFRIYLK
jgi:hypothetical protein